MKQEILIDFSNSETVIFPTVSLAHSYLLALLRSDVRAIGYRCSNASDFERLQDYIEDINQSIKS